MKTSINSSISSMTGFANFSVVILEANGEQCVVDIEIKTFNSKFFEPSCKLPSALSPYEMEIVSRLKVGLVRGRVYCTMRINGQGALLEKMSFSPSRVEEYLQAGVYIQKHFGVRGELSIAEIMALPQVFSTERTALSDQSLALLLTGLDRSIEQTLIARREEGKTLLVDLLKRLSLMASAMNDIEEIMLGLLATKKEEVARTQQLAQGGDEAARALLVEYVSQLDKMDVHEEVVRFRSHLLAIERLLNDENPEKGRKLDFTLQELMREVNTVTAKCANYAMSARAVDIKVEVEKIREQVQNIV